MSNPRKVIFFANTDWYLYNFRLPLAEFLRQTGADVVFVSPGGPYSARLQQAGFRWVAVPMDRRSLNPLRELRLVWHLMLLFRRERPALVHGFTIKCAVYGSLAGRMAKVPARIGAVAGLGYVFASDSAKARVLRPVVRGLLRVALSGRGSRLILQNPDDADLFRRERILAPDRIRVILGSGVDCDRFRPCAEVEPTDLRERPFRVLLATRLLWEKGVGEYVAGSATSACPGSWCGISPRWTPRSGKSRFRGPGRGRGVGSRWPCKLVGARRRHGDASPVRRCDGLAQLLPGGSAANPAGGGRLRPSPYNDRYAGLPRDRDAR
jgi:hypothetical protein